MATLLRFTAVEAPPGRTLSESATCLRAIRSEYREMPGLALTRPQVVRLWNLTPRLAEGLLRELVTCGFLRCNDTGRYVRADIDAH